MPTRARHLSMLILTCLLCMASSSCQWLQRVSELTGKKKEPPPSEDIASVYVTQLKEQELFEPLILAGVVKAKIRRPVIAPLAGTLTVVLMKEGERVRQGQQLLAIEPDSLGLRYNDHKVRAPMGGILTNFRINVGERVNANQVLAEIIDNTRELFTEVAATYEDLETLHNGLNVDVNLSPHSQWENTTNGTITHISPTADETTRTFLVSVDIPCTTATCRDRIRIGTMAKVIARQNIRLGYRVPSRFLHEQQSKILAVTADNKATWLPIKTGKNYGDDVEVLSGLGPATRIVTSFSKRPNEGDQVTISHQENATGDSSAEGSGSTR